MISNWAILYFIVRAVEHGSERTKSDSIFLIIYKQKHRRKIFQQSVTKNISWEKQREISIARGKLNYHHTARAGSHLLILPRLETCSPRKFMVAEETRAINVKGVKGHNRWTEEKKKHDFYSRS